MNTKLILAIALISLAVTGGCLSGTSSPQQEKNKENIDSTKAEFSNISAQEFNQKIKNKDFFLLDVHIPKQEHIAGTDAFIPYNEIEKYASELPSDKSTPIVVYCRSGNMSVTASEKLVEMGYTNVMNLKGGINAFNTVQAQEKKEKEEAEILLETVAPKQGVYLPVKWGNILVKAREAGAIDVEKYNEILKAYNTKFTPEHEKLLMEVGDENIFFSHETALFNLNMLWAIGLVNNNPILMQGKISEYDNPGRFASTGGWTLGTKPGRELLASAKIISLTPKQQMVVENVTRNVYRPCCNNPASFPDCNHGMAALALAELMASQGATEQQIYDALLVANSYWFTQTYVNTAAYFKQQGKNWNNVDAKEVLGQDYSSYSGSVKILKGLEEKYNVTAGAGACGV